MGPARTESSGADGALRVGGVGAAGAVPLGGLAQSELTHQGDGGSGDDGEGDDLGQLVVEELVFLARAGLPETTRQPSATTFSATNPEASVATAAVAFHMKSVVWSISAGSCALIESSLRPGRAVSWVPACWRRTDGVGPFRPDHAVPGPTLQPVSARVAPTAGPQWEGILVAPGV